MDALRMHWDPVSQTTLRVGLSIWPHLAVCTQMCGRPLKWPHRQKWKKMKKNNEEEGRTTYVFPYTRKHAIWFPFGSQCKSCVWPASVSSGRYRSPTLTFSNVPTCWTTPLMLQSGSPVQNSLWFVVSHKCRTASPQWAAFRLLYVCTARPSEVHTYHTHKSLFPCGDCGVFLFLSTGWWRGGACHLPCRPPPAWWSWRCWNNFPATPSSKNHTESPAWVLVGRNNRDRDITTAQSQPDPW